MNEEYIKQFIKAFADFTKHAEVELMDYELRKQESKIIIESEIEQKAAELEVTVDYYMAEFM